MAINGINNASVAVLSEKTAFAAKQLSEGTPLGAINTGGRYDTVELSLSATTTQNSMPPEITHEPLAKADLSHLEGKWVVTIHADGSIDDPIADYNRSQGNYFGDVWRAAMGMPNGKEIYQGAIASGMSEEEAGEHQRQHITEHFRNNFDEALSLAHKFAPPNHEASGQAIEYSAVYNKNGELKTPAKISPKEYQTNLQSIINDVMSYVKANKSDYPNLYKTHFGGE